MRPLLVVLLACVVAAACGNGDPQPTATATVGPAEAVAAAEVEATFAAYRAAVETGDPDVVRNTVTQASIDDYGRLRDLALDASPDTVRALPAVDQLLVLTLRREVEPAALADFTAEEVLEGLVRRGRAGQDRPLGDLGDITVVSEDMALGVVLDAGSRQPTPLRWRFAREDGDWRLDVVDAHGLLSQSIASGAQRTGSTVAELVRATLADLTGEVVGEELYQPLRS